MVVKSLIIYPVKSMGGINVDHMQLGPMGPLHDRIFMLVDKNGKFITQREIPMMSQFKTRIRGDELEITFRNETINLKLKEKSEKQADGIIWRQRVQVTETSNAINRWFSSKLGVACRLVRYDQPRIRQLEKSPWRSKVSFADGYPYLILGTESLNFLNDKLDNPIGEDRFRPNIVIETLEPHIEDSWETVILGNSKFRIIKQCARCVMIAIDQNSGEPGTEPTHTLRDYRKIGKNIMFGVNAVLLEGSSVNIGDKVKLATGGS